MKTFALISFFCTFKYTFGKNKYFACRMSNNQTSWSLNTKSGLLQLFHTSCLVLLRLDGLNFIRYPFKQSQKQSVHVRLLMDEHVSIRSMFKKWFSISFNVRQNWRCLTNHYLQLPVFCFFFSKLLY